MKYRVLKTTDGGEIVQSLPETDAEREAAELELPADYCARFLDAQKEDELMRSVFGDEYE